jgi:hypothetical protein
MIIGNGLLAQAFAPVFRADPEVLVFASGVANSRETRAEEFARERAMLVEALALNKFTVYFSTCSVHDPELASSPYVVHKRELEQLVRERAPLSTIFRLPQVVGATPNPFTLTNYLHQQIHSGAPFQVWRGARRNLIDVSDVLAIGTALIRGHRADNLTTNIACPFSIRVLDLVRIFEQAMDRRANCATIDAGGAYDLDTSIAMEAAAQAGIDFDDHYVRKLIYKYYA